MLGYAGENERVLPASPSSSQDSDHGAITIADSDSDDEARFVMDPSDPRAHDKSREQRLAVHPTRETPRKRKKSKKAVGAGAGVSRWDSDSNGSGQSTGDDGDDGGDDDDEDVGERVPVQVVFNGDNDGHDEDEVDEELGGSAANSEREAVQSAAAVDSAEPLASSSKVKLSKWALSRFLVPRDERTIPVFEELPIEPLNDHILSDFSSRFRGKTGELEVAKAIDVDGSEDDEPAQDKFTVGAPLYSSGDKAAAGIERAPKRGDDESKAAAAPSRKRRENRYFVTDLATKCFNCGQIGHMSSLCMNDKVLRPCYYCGLRGHMAVACPHLPCPTCLQLGHAARDCSNRPLELTNCGVCGRTGHDDANCENADADLKDIRCMVCVQPGHLHCVPLPPPADRKLYCPNCTDRHLLSECASYVEPSQPNYATSNFRLAMKCFVCQLAGHFAAECPVRAEQQSRFNCFKCGRAGHYASDCTSRMGGGGGGGDSRQSGRKRGREHSYTADYDDDYDDDASYYHQVPGGSGSRSYSNNRKSYSNASVRLDAALPSYRGGGGGGYNNSNNGGDRRRGGNGGGRWR